MSSKWRGLGGYRYLGEVLVGSVTCFAASLSNLAFEI